MKRCGFWGRSRVAASCSHSGQAQDGRCPETSRQDRQRHGQRQRTEGFKRPVTSLYRAFNALKGPLKGISGNIKDFVEFVSKIQNSLLRNSNCFWGFWAVQEAPGGLPEEFLPSFVQIRLKDTDYVQHLIVVNVVQKHWKIKTLVFYPPCSMWGLNLPPEVKGQIENLVSKDGLTRKEPFRVKLTNTQKVKDC